MGFTLKIPKMLLEGSSKIGLGLSFVFLLYEEHFFGGRRWGKFSLPKWELNLKKISLSLKMVGRICFKFKGSNLLTCTW